METIYIGRFDLASEETLDFIKNLKPMTNTDAKKFGPGFYGGKEAEDLLKGLLEKRKSDN